MGYLLVHNLGSSFSLFYCQAFGSCRCWFVQKFKALCRTSHFSMVFDLQSFIHFSHLMILQKSVILQLLTQILLWKKRYLWSLINLHGKMHNDCSSGLNIPIQSTDLLHWVIGESECKIHDNYYSKQVIRNSKYSKFFQPLRSYT